MGHLLKDEHCQLLGMILYLREMPQKITMVRSWRHHGFMYRVRGGLHWCLLLWRAAVNDRHRKELKLAIYRAFVTTKIIVRQNKYNGYFGSKNLNLKLMAFRLSADARLR